MYSCRDAGALPPAGFPIQRSPDHRMFSSSPRLIAAYHVFLRLPTPRHPPDALCNLSLEIAFLPFPVQLSMSKPVSRPVGLPPESHSRGFLPPRACSRMAACESAFLTLVGLERLELSTSRLSGVRSNHLSYRPVSAWSFLFRRRQARRCLGHVCLDTLPAPTARLPCRNKKSRQEPRFRPASPTPASLAPQGRFHPSPSTRNLVELVGLEPTTPGLQSRCSPS